MDLAPITDTHVSVNINTLTDVIYPVSYQALLAKLIAVRKKLSQISPIYSL